jgi:L-ascorbate metabolism protein UlaG (beta-lactamase superfamily)
MRPHRRTALLLLLTLIGSVGAAFYAWLRHISAPPYQGPRTDHFDGNRFYNLEPTEDKTLADLVKWNRNKPPKEWTWREIETAVPSRQVEAAIRVTWINHASFLIQTAGVNILTDPVWSKRVSPVSWAGPKRYHAPGIQFEDLPPIDAVIVSHNHFDHMDLGTLRRLAREHQPRFFVPLGNSAFLKRFGITDAVDLDWWESAPIREHVEVVSVPVQHWSTRTRRDLRKTLWSGYVLRTPAGNIYFAGDAGLATGKAFRLTGERFGPFRVALLPIGSHLPRWFMQDHHCSPADAIQAHGFLRSESSIAMHFGCFDLGDDSQHQAPRELLAELARMGISAPSFLILNPGESHEIR